MDAGKRAGSRLAGRAGLAGAALQAGWGAGRAIDEATGVGKKVVEATGLGKLIDNVVNDPDERVKLAPRKEAAPAKAAAPAPAKKAAEPVPKPPVKPSAPARKARAEDTPTSSVREGRNENIDDDTRKRAMASVGMKAGGSVLGMAAPSAVRPAGDSFKVVYGHVWYRNIQPRPDRGRGRSV